MIKTAKSKLYNCFQSGIIKDYLKEKPTTRKKKLDGGKSSAPLCNEEYEKVTNASCKKFLGPSFTKWMHVCFRKYHLIFLFHYDIPHAMHS